MIARSKVLQEDCGMESVICTGCGQQLSNGESVCPACNTALPVVSKSASLEAWETDFNRVKLHWIIVVLMFWVTVAVTAGLFLIHGSAYLNELVLFAIVFMVVGVYLKTRVMYVQRKKPKV